MHVPPVISSCILINHGYAPFFANVPPPPPPKFAKNNKIKNVSINKITIDC